MYILINDNLAYKLIKSDNRIKSIPTEIEKTFYNPLFILDYITHKALYFYDKEKNIYSIGGIDDMEDFMKIISNKKEKIKTLKIKEKEKLTFHFFEYDKLAFDMLNK